MSQEQAPLKVLLLEDAPELVLLFTALLRLSREVECVAIRSGFDKVLEREDLDTFDAALVDQRLGREDGKEILRQLQQRYPLMRRVLITGDHEVDRTLPQADAVLLKPIDIGEVLTALRGHG